MKDLVTTDISILSMIDQRLLFVQHDLTFAICKRIQNQNKYADQLI